MGHLRAVITIALILGVGAAATMRAQQHEDGSFPLTVVAAQRELPDVVHATGHEAVAAYQAAVDHPGAVASVPCLCGCIEALGHASNLDCYIESSAQGVTVYTTHGTYCVICQEITHDAVAGAARGMAPADLRSMIEEKYGE